jgi:ribonuclease R
VAGALRFELLSEGRVISRGRRRDSGAGAPRETQAKAHPGRSPRKKDRKPGKSGKLKKGKSWKP